MMFKSLFAGLAVLFGIFGTPMVAGQGISQLEQWKSDGTNITQQVANKPVKLTGLSTGQCLTLNGSGVITTTNCSTGGTGGLSSTTPWTQGYLTYVNSNAAVTSVATTTLTASAPLSLSNPVAKVGGSNSVLTLDTSGTWSGNAGTATKFQTARTINSVSFDGSANITINAASSTLLANNNSFSGSNTFSSTIAGSVSGNAGTATALAANGTNCSAGNYPLGVDASGNAENCTAASAGASFSYPFPNSATSSPLMLLASTTIGNGTQAGGLTVSGGATTTGYLTGPHLGDAAKYFYKSTPADDFSILHVSGTTTNKDIELQLSPMDVPNPAFRIARTTSDRSTVNVLWEIANTGGVDQVVNTTGSSYNIWARSGFAGPQETAPRLRLRTDFVGSTAGGIVLGDGSGSGDANLYRSAADVLTTDDSLTVSGTATTTNLVISGLGGSGTRFLDVTNTGLVSSVAFPLGTANGGTGTTSYYANGVPFANSTPRLTQAAINGDFSWNDTSRNLSAKYASTTALTVSGSLYLSGLNCTSNANGGALTVNSSGLVSCSDDDSSSGGGAYPFPVATNATTTLTQFNGGLTAYASSTIGGSTGGLTVAGNATTSGLWVNSTQLKFGPTFYPSAAYSSVSSAYGIFDKSNTASDASSVYRDQGAARAETGLVTDNDDHIKVATGSYGSESFTDALIARNSNARIDVTSGLLRSYLTSGTPFFEIGSSDGSSGEGLEVQYEFGNDRARITSIERGTAYRGLTVDSGDFIVETGSGSVTQWFSINASGQIVVAPSAGFALPQGSAPTVDASGEIAVDTTSDQLVYFGVSTKRVIAPLTYSSFSYSTSTTWTGTTTIPLGPAGIAETWQNVQCFTDAGTLNVSFYDGTNRMNLFNASTTIGKVSLSTNNSFVAAEKRYVDIGTPASTPTKIACTTGKTYDAD
jgi:hypothetical protein